jgi:hypothetical protein
VIEKRQWIGCDRLFAIRTFIENVKKNLKVSCFIYSKFIFKTKQTHFKVGCYNPWIRLYTYKSANIPTLANCCGVWYFIQNKVYCNWITIWLLEADLKCVPVRVMMFNATFQSCRGGVFCLEVRVMMFNATFQSCRGGVFCLCSLMKIKLKKIMVNNDNNINKTK